MSKSVKLEPSKKAPQARVPSIIIKLRQSGLRPTRQRIAIACLLLDGRHRHVTAESLTAEITNSGLRVAGGTVYNTLNQFTDAGLLRRVSVHNGYSLFDTNTKHHHHFYEANENKLIDIPSDDVILTRLPQAPENYVISGVNIVIHVHKK